VFDFEYMLGLGSIDTVTCTLLTLGSWADARLLYLYSCAVEGCTVEGAGSGCALAKSVHEVTVCIIVRDHGGRGYGWVRNTRGRACVDLISLAERKVP